MNTPSPSSAPERKGEKEYPPTIEKILRQQPMSTLSTGELKLRKLRAEVSVDNSKKGDE